MRRPVGSPPTGHTRLSAPHAEAFVAVGFPDVLCDHGVERSVPGAPA
ncbi:hypothetical protein B7755_021940 [Streptomyces sp. NBS 14/10]|nr:hypothetical protein B7755_021940 [Streptomyces sp. NBS 14/10]